MKSVNQLLSEAIDKLHARGKGDIASKLIASSKSQEQKLAEAETVLRESKPIRMHNGVLDRHTILTEADRARAQATDCKLSTFWTARKKMGMSEAEARVFAEYDGPIVEPELSEADRSMLATGRVLAKHCGVPDNLVEAFARDLAFGE